MTEDRGDHSHHPHDTAGERSTAPQSDYTAREIGIGAAVAGAGLAVTFGVPLLLA